jgi:hypothetical protein
VRFHRGSSAFALGRLKPGAMNKGEAAYASYLEMRKHAGEVLWWRFEGLKLRLADNTFYTPDFAVMTAECVIECHEVKGFWQDDARAKIKIAADLYPFRFKALKARAKKHGGGWEEEDFSRSGEESVPDMFHGEPPRTYADIALPAEPF